MSPEQKWPSLLWIVRHGESAGNLARERAESAGEERVLLSGRDADVPLSPRGREQAEALARWFAAMPSAERPTALFSSPFLRARETTERIALALEAAGAPLLPVTDERLREREFGIVAGLTKNGIHRLFPREAERRRLLGKYYYRPPGGESWCDVILRLRSLVGTLARDYRRERVVLVGHEVVVLCLRYLFERWTETELLDLDRTCDIANCAVTTYAFDPTLGREGKLVLRDFNLQTPVERGGAEPTADRDVPAEKS